MMHFLDATDSPIDRVDYPNYVDGLTELGFVQIGRVLGVPDSGSFADVAAHFGPRGAELVERFAIPTPALRSPKSDAFVEVCWFFDSPSIRFRTELQDGFLVETLRRWDAPPWDRPDGDIDKLMMKDHAPSLDRSCLVVASSDCGELAGAHQKHADRIAERRGTAPKTHDDLGFFLELSKRTFDRDARYGYDSAESRPVGENVALPVAVQALYAFPAAQRAMLGVAAVLPVVVLVLLLWRVLG